jgi:hypothetical protein
MPVKLNEHALLFHSISMMFNVLILNKNDGSLYHHHHHHHHHQQQQQLVFKELSQY